MWHPERRRKCSCRWHHHGIAGRNLGSRAGRIIIDRTGLDAYYELSLTYDARREASATDATDAPSLFTALREQLGLRLESGRAPVQGLTIDRIERPSAD